MIQHRYVRGIPFAHSIREPSRAVTSASLSATFTIYQHLRSHLSPSRAMQPRDIPLECVCLLDPKVPFTPTPSDGDAAKFTWFVFGVHPRPFLPSLFLLSLPSPKTNQIGRAHV